MASVDRQLNRIADVYAVIGWLGGLAIVIAGVALGQSAGASIGALIVAALVGWAIQAFVTVTLFRAAAEGIRLLTSINGQLELSTPEGSALVHPGDEGEELEARERDQELELPDGEELELMRRPEGFLCTRCRFRVFPSQQHCPGCGRERELLRPAAQ
jgi:hypothetical protein